jgi:hypothetical protein
MRTFQRRFLGLCLLPILMMCLDDGFTLLQQPAAYWSGDYSKAQEGDAWFYHLMAIHPAAFISWRAATALVTVGMILFMPQTLALIISFAYTLGHFVGASTWLLYGGYFRYGHKMFAGLCLLTAVFMAVAIRWGWRAEPQSDSPVGVRWHIGLRWALILLLAGIAAWMNLWKE